MKKNKAYILLVAASLFIGSRAEAVTPDSLQLKARVGYNIGGTTPIPLPETIRSLDSYSLTPSFMAGFDAMLPLNQQWGIMAGLRFENKGMKAEVTTKAYFMEVVKGDQRMAGHFTGHVEQEVKQWMLTVPVQATLTLSRKLMLKGGPYVSFLLDKGFSGIASDGYLRKDTPTGPKILMGNREGEWATYDFDDDMRSVQFGIGIGADWQISKCLGVSADLNWGLTGIFPGDFKTVEQTLYPVYGTIGVFYRLK
ncbi:MAG: PorT family protein [Prevotella sp.]|nr:PorT family protein [Prevotella sp.]